VLVARLFAETTRQRIRRGTFDADDSNPKPFAWTAKARNIIHQARPRQESALAVLSEGCK